MQPFGSSGTIYDSPPVRSFIFGVGSPDLNEPLGGGFQAAHAWINNASNQYLYIPGAPDIVPPGVTRIVALSNTDVAQASWTIPSTFAVVQPLAPAGAAIITFLNAGVDVSPHPGVANAPIVSVASGTVTISGPVTLGAGAATIGAISAVQSTVTIGGTVNIGNTPSVNISGTPTVLVGGTPNVSISGTPTVILGGGSASIGSISAIGSTVTVAGTVIIGNTPAVTISGTPNVTISSGTVSISGQPIINLQSANGVDIYGPNIFSPGASGPFVGGWTAGLGVPTIAYSAAGLMTTTLTAAGNAYISAFDTKGPFAVAKVRPGETYRARARIKQLTRANNVFFELHGFTAAGADLGAIASVFSVTVVGTYVELVATATVPDEIYALGLLLYVALSGAPQIGDQAAIDLVSVQNLGAFPMNAQQGAIPTTAAQVDLGQISSLASGVSTTTLALPTGTQAVAIRIDSGLYAKYDHIIVRGHSNLPNTKTVYFAAFTFAQEIFAFPVLSAFDTQIEVELKNNDNVTVVTCEVVALLQSVPEILQLWPQPQLEPNQPPVVLGLTGAGLASLASMWLINPIPNVSIYLHDIDLMWVASVSPQWIVGHGTVLPIGVAPSSTWLAVGASTTQIQFDYRGAKLPVGHGIWLQNPSGSALTTWWSLFNYSLA